MQRTLLLAAAVIVAMSACRRQEPVALPAPANARHADQTCVSRFEIHEAQRLLRIDAYNCLSQQQFSTALDGVLRNADLANVQTVAVSGPWIAENRAALDDAWRQACLARAKGPSEVRPEEVATRYRASVVPTRVIAAFKARGVLLDFDSLDNVYTLKREPRSAGSCDTHVLPPMLYFGRK